jgi:hypothetical protein
MARIPNTRPTNIYWLFDVRPETLVGHPKGRPFYCGKTVHDVGVRQREHRRDANRHASRPVSAWMLACEDHVRVQIMEIVPVGSRWGERERWWIQTIHVLHPGGANVSAGGEGTPGCVPTAATRAKMSAARKGQKHSPEHCAKIGDANRRRVIKPETRAKISAARMGNPSKTGLVLSPETRARIGAAQVGVKHTVERREKMAVSIRRTTKRRHFAVEMRRLRTHAALLPLVAALQQRLA